MSLYSPIYNEQLHTELVEQLVQNLDVLNSNSNNTILMGTEDFIGNYLQETFFGQVTDLVERRDITVDTATTDKRLSQKENVEVAIDFKTRLFESYENVLRTGRTMSDVTSIAAQQFTVQFIKRHVNLAIGAAVSAAVNTGTMFNSALNTSTCDFLHLLKGQELFDDRHDEVAAYVMNVNAWFDLRRNIISNYKIDAVGGVQIASGMTETMGKPVIVSNIPALSWDSGAGDIKNRIVSLKRGAIMLTERAGRITTVQEVTDQENLGARWASDGTLRIGLSGYSWDIANGGASPTDAALQLGTNWDANTDLQLTGISVVDAEQS